VARTEARPVYGTLYRWRRWQWAPRDSAFARGDTAAPVWPQAVPGPSQRLGARRERYLATVTYPDGKTEEIETPRAAWQTVRTGTPVAIGWDWNPARLAIFSADSLNICVRWRAAHGVAPREFGCPQPIAATAQAPPAAP
jgi:hypothetical protein